MSKQKLLSMLQSLEPSNTSLSQHHPMHRPRHCPFSRGRARGSRVRQLTVQRREATGQEMARVPAYSRTRMTGIYQRRGRYQSDVEVINDDRALSSDMRTGACGSIAVSTIFILSKFHDSAPRYRQRYFLPPLDEMWSFCENRSSDWGK